MWWREIWTLIHFRWERNVVCVAALEKSLEVSQTSPEWRYDPAILPLGKSPRHSKTYVHIKTCAWMFIAPFIILALRWKWFKCPSVDKCINNIWYRHTMDWKLLGHKRESIVQHGWTLKYKAKWKSSQKSVCYTIPCTWNVQSREAYRGRMETPSAWGEVEGEGMTAERYGFSLRWWKCSWKWLTMVAHNYEYNKSHEIVHFK